MLIALIVIVAAVGIVALGGGNSGAWNVMTAKIMRLVHQAEGDIFLIAVETCEPGPQVSQPVGMLRYRDTVETSVIVDIEDDEPKSAHRGQSVIKPNHFGLPQWSAS